MRVKIFTIYLFLSLLTLGCGRSPEVRSYTEVVQLPPRLPSDPALPEMPSDMRAGPLTVAPLPENLPPGHPTLADSAPVGANVMLGRENEVPPPPAAGDLVWIVPPGWRQLPASGMRLAAFAPEGADESSLVTLIVLPEGAGSLEDNLRRWREQVGLSPTGFSAPASSEGQLPYLQVDFLLDSVAASQPQTILGAIYDIPGRRVYLKFMGKTGLLVDHKAGFLQLANSIALKGETAQ